MSELLRAAKAVIDAEDIPTRCNAISKLRTAVERAEKQETVGFREWADETKPTILARAFSEMAWTAAQQAERERCREIVITMGGPDVPELLRQIDSGEE